MRVSCNGFTITNADGEDVGIGLFLGTAATEREGEHFRGRLTLIPSPNTQHQTPNNTNQAPSPPTTPAGPTPTRPSEARSSASAASAPSARGRRSASATSTWPARAAPGSATC